jgi:hypothetical protein
MSDEKKSERSDPTCDTSGQLQPALTGLGVEAALRKHYGMTCSCPVLDVRVEKGKLECGKCGAPFRRATGT